MDGGFMRLAIAEAEKALAIGEIPVGAVVVRGGRVIGSGHNLRERDKNPLLHAELIAISRAAEAVGDWRLNGCDIYVTLEPCVMCSGAILSARMDNVIFGAYDPEYGAAGGRLDLFARRCYGGVTRVVGGVMENECAEILNRFFSAIRSPDKN